MILKKNIYEKEDHKKKLLKIAKSNKTLAIKKMKNVFQTKPI